MNPRTQVFLGLLGLALAVVGAARAAASRDLRKDSALRRAYREQALRLGVVSLSFLAMGPGVMLVLTLSAIYSAAITAQGLSADVVVDALIRTGALGPVIWIGVILLALTATALGAFMLRVAGVNLRHLFRPLDL